MNEWAWRRLRVVAIDLAMVPVDTVEQGRWKSADKAAKIKRKEEELYVSVILRNDF